MRIWDTGFLGSNALRREFLRKSQRSRWPKCCFLSCTGPLSKAQSAPSDSGREPRAVRGCLDVFVRFLLDIVGDLVSHELAGVQAPIVESQQNPVLGGNLNHLFFLGKLAMTGAPLRAPTADVIGAQYVALTLFFAQAALQPVVVVWNLLKMQGSAVSNNGSQPSIGALLNPVAFLRGCVQ